MTDLESDSEPDDVDLCERWNEDEEEAVSDIIRQYEEEPVPVAKIQVPTVQGHSNALFNWLLHVLMFMQAAFHLSDNVIFYSIFSCFFLSSRAFL